MALFVNVDNSNIPAKQTQHQVKDHAYAKDDQLVLRFPVSFVSADLNIRFGSFGLSNDGNSVQQLSNPDAEPECGSDVKAHEQVLIDSQEIVNCEKVDDMKDDQKVPKFQDGRTTNTSVYSEAFDAAARQLDESKTQKIDHAQNVIVKNATPLKNIDRRISKLERMIAHKTVCLKDKNQFIQEIKQLKSMRVHLAADEFQSASNQKDGIEEHQKVESFMDTYEQFWEDCIDELFHVVPYETKIVKQELESISAVTSLETENAIKEEHAYDQNKADLFEEFGHVLENKTDIEEIEAKLNEEILLEKNVKENETHDMNKRNDEKAQTLAEIQAQKTAQLRKKRRIKRLRKKEKQRTGRDATESSKSKRALGNMVVITVMVLALSILSFTNADLPKLVSSQHQQN